MFLDEYIEALRTKVDRPVGMLKRAIADLRLNNFHPTLSKIWASNVDLQFVLDPFFMRHVHRVVYCER